MYVWKIQDKTPERVNCPHPCPGRTNRSPCLGRPPKESTPLPRVTSPSQHLATSVRASDTSQHLHLRNCRVERTFQGRCVSRGLVQGGLVQEGVTATPAAQQEGEGSRGSPAAPSRGTRFPGADHSRGDQESPDDPSKAQPREDKTCVSGWRPDSCKVGPHGARGAHSCGPGKSRCPESREG